MSQVSCSSLSPEDMYRLGHAESRVYLLDVREEDEFQEYHTPLSVNVPLSLIMEGRAQDALRMSKDEAVYLICRSGRRSASACELLGHQGFRQVFNVIGGMDAWLAAGLPVARM
jgi:rhodanese-related sulfurtransferase